MADIKAWITINGAHIPIMEGESKAKAVSRFIKDRKEKKLKGGYGSKKAIDKLKQIAKKSEDEYRKTPDIDDHKQRGSFLSSKEVAAIKKAQDQDEVDMALRYRRSLSKAIKGRGKTNEEKLDEFSKKINKEKQNSPVYALDRATMYMDDKYGKNWDKSKSYKLKTEAAKRTLKGATKTAGMKKADEQYKADVKSNRAYDKKYGKPTYSQIESDNRWRLAQSKKDSAYKYKVKQSPLPKAGDEYTNKAGTTITFIAPTKSGQPQVEWKNKSGEITRYSFLGRNHKDSKRLLKAYGYTRKKK